MPTCENCAHEWSYLETLKGSFNLTNSMTCPNCKQKQYATKKTINLTGFLIFIPLLITFGINFIFGPTFLAIALLLVLFMGVMALYPFIVELSSEEKPI